MKKCDREKIYNKIFRFIIKHKLNIHPTPIEDVCKILNAKLVPLSYILKNSNLKEDNIFSIWGNKDGVINICKLSNGKRIYKISYNDSLSYQRIRFTIMEECSHIILGHTEDPSFNIYNQSYNENLYKQYDEEARMCAGILLFSPKFYYTFKSSLHCTIISDFCNISKKCANVRMSVYDKFKDEIMANKYYEYLPVPKFNLKEISKIGHTSYFLFNFNKSNTNNAELLF